LFRRGELVGAYQADEAQRRPQAFDLVARNGRIGGGVDALDGALGGRARFLRPHFADVFDRFRRLQVARRDISCR
jgi:hypothetical protein